MDGIPDPLDQLLLCIERIEITEREMNNPDNPDDVRISWNTQFIAYSNFKATILGGGPGEGYSGTYGFADRYGQEEDEEY